MGSSRPGLKYNGVSNAWEMTGKAGQLTARFGDSGDILFPRRGAFQIAASSSAVGSGIELSTTRTVAFGIYCDDGGKGTGSDTISGLRVRMLTNVVTAATSREYFVIRAQHVSAAGTTFEHNDAAIVASKEITTVAGSFGGTSGDGVHAAIYARVAVTVTSTDVEDSGMLVGVASMSTITSGYVTVAAGGILAAFFAGKHTGMQSWDYGLYIFSGTCDKAIYAAHTLTSTTGQSLIDLEVTDSAALASSYSKALYINWVATGAKTGGYVNPIAVDAAFTTATCASEVALECMYLTQTGNKLTGNVFIWQCYVEDPGTGVDNLALIDLSIVAGSHTSPRYAFMRCKNHATAARMDEVFYIEGTNNYCATNLFTFCGCNTANDLLQADTTLSGGVVGRIRVLVESTPGAGTTTMYIPLYTS